MDKLIDIYKKYREYITYIIVGGMTTVVNFVVYRIDMVLGMQMELNLVISWIAAVLFAYVTNRIIVFQSKGQNVLSEFVKFVSSRVASLLIEIVLMKLCVDAIGIKEWTSKFLVAVVVVIINYVLSKLWVFTKEADKESDSLS